MDSHARCFPAVWERCRPSNRTVRKKTNKHIFKCQITWLSHKLLSIDPLFFHSIFSRLVFSWWCRRELSNTCSTEIWCLQTATAYDSHHCHTSNHPLIPHFCMQTSVVNFIYLGVSFDLSPSIVYAICVWQLTMQHKPRIFQTWNSTEHCDACL